MSKFKARMLASAIVFFCGGPIASIIALRLFVFKPFSIPAQSMMPTLNVGDYLIAKTVSKPVERGEVVVFLTPSSQSVHISRIIGTAGDTVQLKDSNIFLNGSLVERKKIDDFVLESPLREIRKVSQYEELMPGRSVPYRVLEESGSESHDSTTLFTVPAEHIFVLGDNRDNSVDSRFLDEVGFIPERNIIGRASFVIWNWTMKTLPLRSVN